LRESAEIKPFEPDPVNTREGKSALKIQTVIPFQEFWFRNYFSLGNPL